MSISKFVYTGVGSRSTPPEICNVFRYLASELASRMGRLRSGHADGPDMAFEEGSLFRLGDGFSTERDSLGREIFLPWKKFNGRRRHFDPYTDTSDDDEGYYVPDEHWPTYKQAVDIAKSVIPWWDKLKPPHQRLHTRNVYQVLGMMLNEPSDLLICNASLDKGGQPTGGTRTAILIAEKYEVPVFNRQKYKTDDDFIEAVLAFVTDNKGITNGTNNSTESQEPKDAEVNTADNVVDGTVASPSETATEAGGDAPTGKGG